MTSLVARFTRSPRARWITLAVVSLIATGAFAQSFPPRPPSTAAMVPPAAPDLAARARVIAEEARLLRHFPIDVLWGTR